MILVIFIVCIILSYFYPPTTPIVERVDDVSNSCFDNFPGISMEKVLPSYCNRVTRCPKHGICKDSRLKECRKGVINSTGTECGDDLQSTNYHAILLQATLLVLLLLLYYYSRHIIE